MLAHHHATACPRDPSARCAARSAAGRAEPGGSHTAAGCRSSRGPAWEPWIGLPSKMPANPRSLPFFAALASALATAATEPPALASVVLAAPQPTKGGDAPTLLALSAGAGAGAGQGAEAGAGPGAGAGADGAVPSPMMLVTGAPNGWLEPALLAAALLNGYRPSQPPDTGDNFRAAVTVEFYAMPPAPPAPAGDPTVVGDITCGAGVPVTCTGRVDTDYPHQMPLLLHELLHAAGFAGPIDGHTAGEATVAGGHWDDGAPRWAIMRAVLPAAGAGLWTPTLDAVGLHNHCAGPHDAVCSKDSLVCAPATPSGVRPGLALPWRCAAVAATPTDHHHHLPPGYEHPHCTACVGNVLAAAFVAALALLVFCVCAVPAALPASL